MRTCWIVLVSVLLIPSIASLGQQVQAPSECRLIKAADLVDPLAPSFDAYPVFREEVANPRLNLASNPIARKYRTVLRLAITEGRISPGITGLFIGVAARLVRCSLWST